MGIKEYDSKVKYRVIKRWINLIITVSHTSIGSDGFSWWIGQVETNKKDDPRGQVDTANIGQHLKTGDNTSTENYHGRTS